MSELALILVSSFGARGCIALTLVGAGLLLGTIAYGLSADDL